MTSTSYTFPLPPDLVAQTPARPRDSSRLLVIDRQTGQLSHHHFFDLPRLLRPTDVLVFNQSAVFPARLLGRKSTGGKVEVLLLKKVNTTDWEVISHPGLRSNQSLIFAPNLSALVLSPNTLRFSTSDEKQLTKNGRIPLPPYIHSHIPSSQLRRQYQTVYAKDTGSSAAPTAPVCTLPAVFSVGFPAVTSSNLSPCTSAWVPSNLPHPSKLQPKPYTPNPSLCPRIPPPASTLPNRAASASSPSAPPLPESWNPAAIPPAFSTQSQGKPICLSSPVINSSS